jgi:hypothetical protein
LKKLMGTPLKMYCTPALAAATYRDPPAHINRQAPSICRMLSATLSFMQGLH